MSARIQWTGVDDVLNGMSAYEKSVHIRLERLARFIQAKLEAYAKINARWTDRTANARQSLAAYLGGEAPEKPSGEGGIEYPDTLQPIKDVIEVYLSHGMNYGVFLEVVRAGELAIIWETIEAHLPEIRQLLNDNFG